MGWFEKNGRVVGVKCVDLSGGRDALASSLADPAPKAGKT
jgi:hypothetical protein